MQDKLKKSLIYGGFKSALCSRFGEKSAGMIWQNANDKLSSLEKEYPDMAGENRMMVLPAAALYYALNEYSAESSPSDAHAKQFSPKSYICRIINETEQRNDNMINTEIEKEMYQKAVELIEKRYPSGWGGAAVVHTEKGSFFTSVCIESANASAILCIETGAILEAHKYNEKVTHCLCLVRDDENSPYKVLSPCGICQERLRFWGDKVKVAVTTPDDSLLFVELKELQPYHWTNAYSLEELDHFIENN